MSKEPSYYAIIPANVRYDKRIIPNAKLLYGEITALANKTGYCYAGDSYFMNLYSAGKSTIQSRLRLLESCGYIKRYVIYKQGKKEIESRYINITHPMLEIEHTPMLEIEIDNNTLYNNTYYNNKLPNSNEIGISAKNDNFDKYNNIFINKLNSEFNIVYDNIKTQRNGIKLYPKKMYDLCISISLLCEILNIEPIYNANVINKLSYELNKNKIEIEYFYDLELTNEKTIEDVLVNFERFGENYYKKQE